MPYISESRRDELDQILDLIRDRALLVTSGGEDPAGDLNYLITRILMQTYELADKPKYAKFNSALGVLTAVTLEMYRRAAAPYEDVKAGQNGDIPEFEELEDTLDEQRRV